MRDNALTLVGRARDLCEQMVSCTSAEDWEKLSPLDQECRALMDQAIDRFPDLDEKGQKEFRLQAAEVLSLHRQALIQSKEILEQLRLEVKNALSSKRAANSYLDNS